MVNMQLLKRNLIILTLMLTGLCSKAQFLMDMVDTTSETGKGLLSIYKKYDHLRFGGYIQPEFQVASSKGIKTFEGPIFGERVSNRFLLRRSRIRIDYAHFNEEHAAGVQFVFQFDANERGFTVRDVWGRIFENKYKLFAFTTGMFARPFGYETNLSSSDRESPERGRMNQTLMKSERDLGAMISFDARKEIHPFKNLKIDVGLFNGQGIASTGEFDNNKDLITRVSLKPTKFKNKVLLSAGASMLYGGLENNTKYYFTTVDGAAGKQVQVDSSLSNLGKVEPRRYYGADIQLKVKTKAGYTELRGEVITGKQTANANSSETPVDLLTGTSGFYTRNFRGAYFYFLRNIFSSKHQLILKYDFYDPNTKVSKKEIGTAAGFTTADIKYNTVGVGYLNYITPNVKLVLYYAKVNNESTSLSGYTKDAKDDVFTCRLQFRF